MIRDYSPSDFLSLAEIHLSQGFDYALPDLNSPLFLVRKVREENGVIVGAMFLRLSCETFLLVGGGPKQKWESMKALQPAVLSQAWEKGIDDVHAVVPPNVVNRFRKRLEQLGWTKDREWPMYSRRTGE